MRYRIKDSWRHRKGQLVIVDTTTGLDVAWFDDPELASRVLAYLNQ